MRTRLARTAARKGTARWMTSLSETVAAVVQMPSAPTSTVKAVGTPSLLEITVIPDSCRASGREMVRTSG